ncbi:MAG: hypothetical protein ACPL7D_08120, partial [Candidatus Sumerlaeaceae bacterium]
MLPLAHSLIALFLLAGLVLLVGYALSLPLLQVLHSGSKKFTLGEAISLCAVTGVAAATFLGLALGYAGFFSLHVLGLGLGGVASMLLAKHRAAIWTLRAACPSKGELAAAALALVLIAYATALRSHEIAGMRDQGVYTATGIQLARTGSFFWRDALITKYGFERVAHLFEDIGEILQGRPRYLRFAGFYLDPPDCGRVVPQFLHGYEVWIALAYQVGGPQATQCVNGVFAALGLFAFFLVIRRLYDTRLALLGAILLATSLPQLWYARFPSNEPVLQFLIWGVLLSYILLRDVARTHASTCDNPLPRSLNFPLFLPIAAAATVKFAFWPLLAVFAFELGAACHQQCRCLRTRSILGWLLAISLFAYLHAFFFARFYLYGSWNFTIRKFGITFQMFPVILIGGTMAAFVAGAIVSDFAQPIAKLWSRVRGIFALLFFALIAIVYVYQCYVGHYLHSSDVWSEQTNLYEFAQYYGILGFAVAVAGFALWLKRGNPHETARLLVLLILAASVFLVKRNLDAIHPWASRRWLPVLVPSMALAAALALNELSTLCSRAWRRLVSVAGTCAVVASQLLQGPLLVTTANYRGAIPQVDQWTRFLHAEDFVLLEPTALIAQFGPYLAARFDIQGYVQKNTPEFWEKTKNVAFGQGQPAHRTIYVTDEDLSVSCANFARLVGTSVLHYPVILDKLRSLPERALHIHETVRFYELDWAKMPAGWWTGWKPKLEPGPPSPLPAVLRMGSQAEPYLVQGFFDPTPQNDGTAYRWTNGNARLAIGRLIKFPLPQRPIRIIITGHSGRKDQSLEVHWYLDLDKPYRAKKLAVTTVGRDWTVCAVSVPPEDLAPDSTLELQSLRPAVAPEFPAGRLG